MVAVPRDQAVVPAAAQGVGAAAGDRPGPFGSAWAALIPAAVTLLVVLYRLNRPSYTRDEGATLLAVHRGFGQLLAMLGHNDAVHGTYYALMWVVTRVAGSSELVTRLPSAVAMAVAAGFVALLGARLASGLTGLAAGLVFAALPQVSAYAGQARPYAIVTALAAVASYLLVRALDAEGSRRRWLVGYGVVLCLLGLFNLFALLLIPAHAVMLAAWLRRGGSRGVVPSQRGGGPRRPLVAGWLIAAAAAVVVASPVMVVASGQMHQIHWIKRPRVKEYMTLMLLAGKIPLFLTVLVVVAAAVAVSVAGGRSRLRADWPPGLVGLALPWLVLPPALLLAVSYAHPVYTFRYIMFCEPAVALLAGAALVALRPLAGTAALAVIVLVALPNQIAFRTPAGHGYNIRLADQVVAANARPGDALVNVPYWPARWGGGVERGLEGEYPYGLARLRDLTVGKGPLQSATLGGSFAPDRVVRQRLATVHRVWVASWSRSHGHYLTGLGFRLVHRWHVRAVWLWLYTRG